MEDLGLKCSQAGYCFSKLVGDWVHFSYLGFSLKCKVKNFPPKQLKTSNLIDRSQEAAFIFKKLEQVHKGAYSYENSVYSGCNGTFDVLCRQHGIFKISYTNHLQGKGCKQCGIERTARKSQFNLVDFVRKSTQVHGSKYDYTCSVYIKNDVKTGIRCKDHGIFWQTPASHWQGNGCPKCGDIRATEKKLQQGFAGYSKKSYCNLVKVASVYLLRITKSDEILFKIGISKNVRRRMLEIANESCYQVSCLFLKSFPSEDAYDLEKHLHKTFEDQKATPLNTFKGSTECFNNIPFSKFLKTVQIF